MSSSRRMLIAFLLNLSFALIEAFFGLTFRSSAVLADALHDAGDALAIGSAVFLEKYAEKPADDNYGLGYQRFSILGSIVTGFILLSGSGFVLVENVPKLWSPDKVNYQGMLVLGIVAILVNTLASRVISHGHSHRREAGGQGNCKTHLNHNERVLRLHFLEDILGWLAVIVVALLIPLTQWYFLDPLLSIGIALFIMSKSFPQFLSAIKILLNAKPEWVDVFMLRKMILAQTGVVHLNHIVIFAMSDMDNWALIKLVVKKTEDTSLVRNGIRQILAKQGIHQSVIEISHC